MNDVLFLITSKLDNQSLEVLSHIPDVWKQIRIYQLDQEWWFLRVEQFVGRQLRRRIGSNWREAYRALSWLDLTNPNSAQFGSLAYDILIEIYSCSLLPCRASYRSRTD